MLLFQKRSCTAIRHLCPGTVPPHWEEVY